MSKWRVEKFTGWRTTSPWRVVNQHGVIADYFPTHHMAIGYADRMARTVQVVLPRELPTTLNHNNLTWGTYGLDIQDSLDGQEVGFNPPAPRTLADMAPVERAECEWMQCDHPALEEPGVILQIWGNGCHVVSREGVVETEALNHVTPRPDLPRMQWPGNEPDDVAAATGGELTTQDVVDKCRAVRKERSSFYAAAPRPEDVPVGEAWQVEVDGRTAIGYRNDQDDKIPWLVVYRNIPDIDWLYDSDVTLISRLVPETAEQDAVPEFDPAYTYTDRDGDEWEYLDGRWITGDTHAKRVAARESCPGIPSLRAVHGPYTRIEKEEDNE